ncbi:MAG: DUF1353 domain-containing protein [Marinibacterium sp.]|nr:DUF1353 domain-containing protein [Marinibacterium sp.]
MPQLTPSHAELRRDRDNYRRWYLNEDVTVALTGGHTAIIPKGYRFDAHSVPGLLRIFFRKYNKHDVYASMVHDFLIEIEGFHRFDRKYMDLEYWRLMEHPDYFGSRYRRYFMPRAVRFWGWLKWDLRGDYRGTVLANTHLDMRGMKQAHPKA